MNLAAAQARAEYRLCGALHRNKMNQQRGAHLVQQSFNGGNAEFRAE